MPARKCNSVFDKRNATAKPCPVNIAPPFLALLLLLAAGGCATNQPGVEYDGATGAPLRSASLRPGYTGPELVEQVDDIAGRREELAKGGHVVLASGSLLVAKGDGVKELTKLAKIHGADVVLFDYLDVGSIERVERRREMVKKPISPTEAMAYYRRSALNGGTLYTELEHASLKQEKGSLLRFVLLKHGD